MREMSDRIHEFLDGKLRRDTLSPEEIAQLEEFEEAIEAVREGIPKAAGADLAPLVMDRLRTVERTAAASPVPSPFRRAWSLLWSPRLVQLRLRPAYALATAALAGLLLLRMPEGETPPAGSAPVGPPVAGAGPAAAESAARVLVQFRLDVPEARSVALAGTFTGWRPDHEMHEVAPGVWSIVVSLPPGVHDYGFVIDGDRWVTDPNAVQVADGFGGANSRIALLGPELEETS